MKRLLLYLIIAVSFLHLFGGQVYGQAPATKDSIETIILAMPVTEIVIKATEVNTILREKRTMLLSDEQKLELSSRLDTLLFRLVLLREDPRIHKTEELNLRSLQNLQSEWEFLDNLLEGEQASLTNLLQKKENERTELAKLLFVWELTAKT